MKKLLLAFPMIGSAVTAFADSEVPTAAAEVYSGSVAEAVVNTASNSLINFLQGSGVVLVRVLGVVIAIWFAIVIVNDFKKAFTGSSGRYDRKRSDS